MKEISQADLSSILKHISSLQQQSLLRKFCQQVTNQKPCLIWDILKENILDEAVYIDKSQEPFNALTKKRQTITVCLRATCKDGSIK